MSKVNHSFRKGKSGGFAYVSNDVLKNEKLSLEAKGLYSYIQTYIQIPDIEVSKKFLLENCISNDKEIMRGEDGTYGLNKTTKIRQIRKICR